MSDNLPDDWDRHRERCPHCGRTFHPAEGCDCEECPACGDATAPERLSGDDGLCGTCRADTQPLGAA